MDDFIYVLLFIGWIAYSIFSAIQKNKQKELRKKSSPEPYPASEESVPENPARKVLEEIFGEDHFEESEETFEPEPVYEEVERRPTVQMRDEIDQNRSRMILTHFSTDKTWDKPDAGEQPVEAETLVSQKEKFDLRNAVIYAAILQRPYN